MSTLRNFYFSRKSAFAPLIKLTQNKKVNSLYKDRATFLYYYFIINIIL